MRRVIRSEGAGRRIFEQRVGDPVALEREVDYPYFWFRASASLNWPFRGRSLTIDCLVDARTGSVATTDPFDVESCAADPAMPLDACHDPAAADATARRFAAGVIARRLRSPGLASVNLESCGVVYRRLAVVTTAAGRFLADPATGDCYPLKPAGETAPAA